MPKQADKMQFFDFKLRIGGSPLYEVMKSKVSAAEMFILGELHGSDAILSRELVAVESFDDAELREELVARYKGVALGQGGPEVVATLVDRKPLETEAEGFSSEEFLKAAAKSAKNDPMA